MSVYLLLEWTNPKEEERNEKRLKQEVDFWFPYLEKKAKEGVKMKPLALTDGTGRMLTLFTFETMEDFAKVWDDMEFKRGISQFSYLVDDFTSRLLRGVVVL